MKVVNGIRYFHLELSEHTLNELSAALMRDSRFAVIAEINSQVNAQQRPAVVSGSLATESARDCAPMP